MHEITVVNIKSFKGESEYIGRTMPGIQGSPLGNPYRVKPHGPYERDESVLKLYRRWLWNEMQDPAGAVRRELLRLKKIAEERPLRLSCFCAPLRCHGEVVRAAILYLAGLEEGAACKQAA